MSKKSSFNYSEYTISDELEELAIASEFEESIENNPFPPVFIPTTKNEIEIAKLVSDTIEAISEPTITSTPDNIELILQEAETGFKEIFGEKYLENITEIPIKLHKDFDIYSYGVQYFYEYYIENGIPINDAIAIHIPESLPRFSSIALGHEFIHTIKDISYYEFMEKLQFGEVIPQFYEFLTVDSSLSHLKEEWLKVKIFLLSEIKDDAYDSALNEALGHYYSVLMYNLYRKNPKEVLKGVNEVLRHNKTTSELLKEMELYKINEKNIKTYKQERKLLLNQA